MTTAKPSCVVSRDRLSSGSTAIERSHVALPLAEMRPRQPPRLKPRSSASAATAERPAPITSQARSEEHTSELQSRLHLVCRLLLEKKTFDVVACKVLLDPEEDALLEPPRR